MLQMKEDETIDAFTTKLTTLVNKASSLGHTMEDETLVRKLLNVVPDRLKTYEERIKYKGKQVDNQDRLLFTRYEEQGRRRGHVKDMVNILQHLPFSPATIPGNPGRLIAGITFPCDMSPEKSRTEKLEWDTFPGDNA
nr:hypothetical protein [Tanacetum cinerariifolium]